ncbi:hypothetical protein JGU66_13070 [Myxococcaceae bacterium JPH2]|nr:hypothetical protein [Myxococcaceae bacterium JPH2]
MPSLAANLPSGLNLGAGGTFALPTASDLRLGAGKLSLGPSALGVYTHGPLVAGLLATQVFSVAGDSERSDVSILTPRRNPRADVPA